jgi:hypothetical protein
MIDGEALLRSNNSKRDDNQKDVEKIQKLWQRLF